MNIFRIIMRGRSQEPPIVPPIARGSFDVTLDFADDKDKNACLEWIENGKQEKLYAMCCRCHYWSGTAGSHPADLICAVNIPRPTKEALEIANNTPAFALHDCQDFEIKPESGDRPVEQNLRLCAIAHNINYASNRQVRPRTFS